MIIQSRLSSATTDREQTTKHPRKVTDYFITCRSYFCAHFETKILIEVSYYISMLIFQQDYSVYSIFPKFVCEWYLFRSLRYTRARSSFSFIFARTLEIYRLVSVTLLSERLEKKIQRISNCKCNDASAFNNCIIFKMHTFFCISQILSLLYERNYRGKEI